MQLCIIIAHLQKYLTITNTIEVEIHTGYLLGTGGDLLLPDASNSRSVPMGSYYTYQ